jgi:hypothetical protein
MEVRRKKGMKGFYLNQKISNTHRIEPLLFVHLQLRPTNWKEVTNVGLHAFSTMGEQEKLQNTLEQKTPSSKTGSKW